MFQNFLLQITTCTEEYSYVVFQKFTTLCNGSELPGISLVNSTCTSYTANLITEQLNLATKVGYSVCIKDPCYFDVTHKDRIHRVHVEDNQLKYMCAFVNSMALPCRHILLYELARSLSHSKCRWWKKGGPNDIKVFLMINQQWMGFLWLQMKMCFKLSSSPVSKCLLLPSPIVANIEKSLIWRQKLATAASVCGMAEFQEKYHSLEHVLALWEVNILFTITPKEEGK